MKWIDIKDRLPEKGVMVLGFSNDYNEKYISLVIVNEYTATDGINVLFENYEPRLSNTNVTHWMPLPEPPEN